jgi:hypothetical protein
MTDMRGTSPLLYDLLISNCKYGFDLKNQGAWTERLTAIDISDYNNTHLFFYDQNSQNPNNSYGYGSYLGIYIYKTAGQDVFYLTGGAFLYHSSFTIKGNFDGATGASIFNVQGTSGQPCPGASYNTYDISVEGNSPYAVVSYADNGCTNGATGHALVAGTGSVSASGATANTNSWITTTAGAHYVGTIQATGPGSGTVTAQGIYPTSACYITAGDAVSASGITGSYVSATNWGVVTITFPDMGGSTGNFLVWCQ